MIRSGTLPAVLLAFLAASGCGDVQLDVKVPGHDEAMKALADTLPPPEMTRAEALEKHRECMRNLHSPTDSSDLTMRHAKRDPGRACSWWLLKAYPEPEHARRLAPDSLWIRPTPAMTREEADRRLLDGLRNESPTPRND